MGGEPLRQGWGRQLLGLLAGADAGLLRELRFLVDLDDLVREAPPEFRDDPDASLPPSAQEALALRWFADRRPLVRRLLLAFLGQRPEDIGHGILVRALFGHALQAGDDELLAAFLVLFDRGVRRVWRQTPPAHPDDPVGHELVPEVTFRGGLGLPAVLVLRKRVWGHFDALARTQPHRYVAALLPALRAYTDADLADGLQQLDNHGLMHAFFGASEALRPGRDGWTVAPHRALPTEPAPAHMRLWERAAAEQMDLLRTAGSALVRRWALRLLLRPRRHPLGPPLLRFVPLMDLFALLRHRDREVFEAALLWLRSRPVTVAAIEPKEWFALLDSEPPERVGPIADLAAQFVRPEEVSFERFVGWCIRACQVAGRELLAATAHPLFPLYRWLFPLRTLTEPQRRLAWRLANAGSDFWRRPVLHWLRTVYNAAPAPERAEWLLTFLTSAVPDVREEGQRWLNQDVGLLRNDEVQRRLRREFGRLPLDSQRVARQALGLPGYLPAQAPRPPAPNARRATPQRSAMPPQPRDPLALALERGGRALADAVRDLTDRLDGAPEAAADRLPQLALVLRQARGPAWRQALAAAVRLAERRPELLTRFAELLPELRFE